MTPPALMTLPGGFLKKNNLAIVFRTDASSSIGTGHVIRCLTLAIALQARGATVSFICRELEGHLCDLITERGLTVVRLPAPITGPERETAPPHASWLGTTWQEDAEQTRSVSEALVARPDWLVVDHYALDYRWEQALHPSVGRIMVIDDLADRPHDCDLLLDQNLVVEMVSRYADKVPADCGLLLGPKYALLQPDYSVLHDRTPAREGRIKRIFIYFGGVDSDNLTGRALNAFMHLNRPEIEVDVVIAKGSPHAKLIQEQVAGQANIHLHANLPILAPLMAQADLAIGAGGTTHWERLCLGLPTIIVTVAENQRSVTANLQREGLVDWIGHKDEVKQQTIGKALERTIDSHSLVDWSSNCLAVCDGRGTSRVVDILLAVPVTNQRLVAM